MTIVHANIRIHGSMWNARLEPTEYYWTATILGVECLKCQAFYKTVACAERVAIRWCNRLGLPHTVTFDNGVKR